MTEQKAIEELKYQEDMRAKGIDYQVNNLVIGMAISALEEIQQYRALGTLEEIKVLKESALSGLELANIWAALEQLKKYEAVGTLEELREAKEKQVPKKPKECEDKYYGCPVCGNVLLHKWLKYPTQLANKTDGLPYCLGCGQTIDWSNIQDCKDYTVNRKYVRGEGYE